MGISLYDYQLDAINRLKVGSILCGNVGSGKSRTSVGFYFLQNGGSLEPFSPMKAVPKDLYIITTAKKRDSEEWLTDLAPFGLSDDKKACAYPCSVKIDSWNNIHKYAEVKDAFFIFDEQRVVGYGAWTKNFLRITKHNDWILLTATPGDTWSDYIPVFIANGFYRNKTDFDRQHVVYNTRAGFPKIDRYLEQARLIRYRNMILVNMEYTHDIQKHEETITCDYDRQLYRSIMRDRWDPYANEPIVNGAQFCGLLRRVVNSDPSRLDNVLLLLERHKRLIIFYNFNYELELLRKLPYPSECVVAELNGDKHDLVPTSDSWVYLVQYFAGAEAWNCTATNAMLFYSQSYSYKTMTQAKGRIDRLNTKYEDLYYYIFRSNASIDYAIARALADKRDFNERRFYGTAFGDSRKKLTL